MATSAFKSTTKRASIGGSSSEDSSTASRSRRSRSLSRFSRPIEPDDVPESDKNVSRGNFVNSTRELTTQFPEISLDDLTLESFSSSSYENGSNSEVGERKERQGRSVSRCGEIGRWASDTASSRRRGRSVSRAPGHVPSSSTSASRAKSVSLADAGQRRRRSLSVAPYLINDFQIEENHSRKSSNRANVKTPIRGNAERTLTPNATASSDRRLRRSQSHKDLSMHDGYWAEHPIEDVADGGFGEVMRKELRYAAEQIRTELNEALGRNQTAVNSSQCMQSDYTEAFQDISRTRKNYSSRLEQLEKRKKVLLTEMLLEDQRALSKVVKKLPDSRTSAVAENPSRARKRSSDRHRMSKRLTEGAEKYFEDFISNIEDTDISSFDGERSDCSSTLGGTTGMRDPVIRVAETKSPYGSTSSPGEMDGVTLPWLQWEIGHDSPVSANTKAQTPLIPRALQWNPEKGMISLDDPSNHSMSSFGSCSPSLLSHPTEKSEDRCQIRQLGNDRKSCDDLDEYLNLRKNEELLFEMHRERNRINSGCLLLCAVVL
ncbi:hypothetical protein CDL12_15689 [Handroanthus impetiginosus]|uniref:Uncharacterized protein n=1 Tax=Handroanthus impetiginosus TaxID=429701 RepID=A0A2G9H2H8_9LAMI|nr:hypothetical protein CDL12_21674 [Handroanthus impetiginosus]PIN11703.1 hypothetical protein CDL12_15689 [Handroanthus impetiginosus]